MGVSNCEIGQPWYSVNLNIDLFMKVHWRRSIRRNQNRNWYSRLLIYTSKADNCDHLTRSCEKLINKKIINQFVLYLYIIRATNLIKPSLKFNVTFFQQICNLYTSSLQTGITFLGA